MNKVYFIKFFFFAFVLIFLDQVSKYLIRSTGGFYICNPGIAFGLPFFWSLIFLGGIFLFFLGLHLVFGKNNSEKILIFKKSNAFSLLLIFSGAVGNLIDRLLLGCVIDFIDIRVWPVFNFADIYITIGGAMIFWSIFKNKKQ